MKKLLLMTAMGVGLAACSLTPVDTSAVSYTHLTLPTIYSV